MAKPKGLAVVIGLGKPKGKGEDEPSPESEDTEAAAPSEDEYGSELAQMLGVEDAAAFSQALAGFVRACMRKEDAGGYEEGEGEA